MKNRLLTIDDLYNYFLSINQNVTFSSKSESQNLVIQIPGNIQFSTNNKDIEGLMPVRLWSCHILKNRNGSNITEKSMKNALSSFLNRPILGYIHEVDGEPHFYSHNMHMDEDNNIVYDEFPVGVIPESGNPHLEYDDKYDKNYVVVDGYIFEEYSKAAEILHREEECSVSVELSIRELSYDAAEKVLNLDDFYFSGVTILGCDEDGNLIQPGMEGARLDIADFSMQNNSVIANQQDKLIESLDKLTTMLANFNINPAESGELKEGGNLVNKFEELLEQYGKTVEDIDFEYDNLTDEELEAKFAEVFGESAGEGEDEPEPTSDDDDTAEEDFADEEQNDEEDEKAEDGDDEEFEEEVAEDNQREFSVTCGDSVRNFAVSMSEVLAAMSELVNNTYSETDNDYYSVDVYESEKSVVMVGWWSGKAYKQSYKVRNDVYTLTGDRVAVKPVYLTADEEAKLDDMRSNYSLISEKLAKYESEPQKVAILESDDYANVADVEAFVELKKQENHFDLSVDEVTEKANQILLDYAKHNNIKFSDDSEKKSVGQKKLPVGGKRKSSRYGNLFSKR